MATTSVSIDLLAKDKASGAIHAVGDSVGQLHTRTVAVGAALGAALGLGIAKLVEFGKSSVSAYVEAQQSQVRLQDAFSRFPKLADTNVEALQRLNESLQQKTGADHNAIASGEAVLAQFNVTGQQLTGLTPLLVDYATKTGRDLPDAATMLGRAFLGNTRALKELGINYKSTHDQAQDVANITGLLREKVGGFADKEGKSAAGQAKILSADFKDIQEKIGQQLLPVLMRLGQFLISDVIPAMEQLGSFLSRNSAILVPLGAAIGTVVVAVKAWTAVQKVLDAELFANPIGLVVLAIAGLVVGLVAAYEHSQTFRDGVKAAFDGVKVAAEAVANFFSGTFLQVIGRFVQVNVDAFHFILEVWLAVVGGIIDGAAKALGWVPGVGGKLKQAARAFDGFRDEVNSTLSNIASEAGGWGQSVGDNIGAGMVIGLQQHKGGLVTTMSNVVDASIRAGHAVARAQSPSRRTMELGKFLAQGLIVGFDGERATLLSKMSSAVEAAIKTLRDKIDGFQQKMAARVQAARDALTSAVNTHDQYASGLRSGLLRNDGITGAIDPTTGAVGSLSDFLTSARDQMGSFSSALGALKTGGLSMDLLQQIAEAGPAQGLALAQSILGGASGPISSLNAIESDLTGSATGIGAFTADSLYGGDIATSTKTLQDQLAEQRQMNRLLALVVEKVSGDKTASQVLSELQSLKKTGVVLGLA